MKKAISAPCAAVSLVCTIVFFATYYGGIFYNLKFCFAAAAVITTPLLVSGSFNKWAAKTGFYFAAVVILVGISQAYDLNRFIIEKIRPDLSGISWGEQLMLSNCLWFGVVFACSMISLGITAVIVYKKGAQEDGSA